MPPTLSRQDGQQAAQLPLPILHPQQPGSSSIHAQFGPSAGYEGGDERRDDSPSSDPSQDSRVAEGKSHPTFFTFPKLLLCFFTFCFFFHKLSTTKTQTS